MGSVGNTGKKELKHLKLLAGALQLELLAAGAIDRSKSFAAWKLELKGSGYKRVRFSGMTAPEFPEEPRIDTRIYRTLIAVRMW